MMAAIEISDRLWVGPRPSDTDLGELSARQFRSVLNLRTLAEASRPEVERFAAEAVDLVYRHLPIDAAELTEGTLAAFRDAIERLPRPVYVHCAAGQRAIVLSLLVEREDASADQILDEANTLGIAVKDSRLRAFVAACTRGVPDTMPIMRCTAAAFHIQPA